MKHLISETASATTVNGAWHSLIRCQQSRCSSQETRQMQAEHVESFRTLNPSKEEQQEVAAKQVAFWVEAASHPLPDGWVQLRIAGEDRITDSPHNFCSSHCAVLWLNAYQRAQRRQTVGDGS